MLLHLTDLSPEPLHEQISRQIRAQILAGTLEPGTALASIRALAREQKVSVITVQRSYDDLLRAGLLLSRRGKGFFVERPEDIRPAIEAAFAAGVPACINVMTDPTTISPGSVTLASVGAYKG